MTTVNVEIDDELAERARRIKEEFDLTWPEFFEQAVTVAEYAAEHRRADYVPLDETARFAFGADEPGDVSPEEVVESPVQLPDEIGDVAPEYEQAKSHLQAVRQGEADLSFDALVTLSGPALRDPQLQDSLKFCLEVIREYGNATPGELQEAVYDEQGATAGYPNSNEWWDNLEPAIDHLIEEHAIMSRRHNKLIWNG